MKYTELEIKIAKIFFAIIMIAIIMSALTGCASQWHTVDIEHRVHYPNCNICNNGYHNTYPFYYWNNNITIVKPNKPNRPNRPRPNKPNKPNKFNKKYKK